MACPSALRYGAKNSGEARYTTDRVIKVIAVIWRYDGISPDEMEKRVVNQYERVLTTAVNDIEHIESQSLYGVAVVKIFFHASVSFLPSGLSFSTWTKVGSILSLPMPIVLRTSS